MKRLSVILPMYNVEPYVEKCIRSLEDQDIPETDFEIICINDGSPDNSREVVRRLQREFSNIILINQENKGVSRARNNGIDQACGKYLLFIDPDDYVDRNSFKRVLDHADNNKIQVSFLGFTFRRKDGNVYQEVINKEHRSGIFSGTKAYYLARGNGRVDPDRMVAVLFKTEFINRNKLRYLSNVPYLEDGEFIARILCLADRCIFDGYSFYQRTTRQGSATNSNLFYTEKAMNGFLLAAINLKRFQEQKDLSEEQRCFLNQPICKFVFLTLGAALHKVHIKKYRKIKKKLVINNLKPLKLKGIARPYIYYARIYNYFFVTFIIQALFKELTTAFKTYLKKIL